jgi:acetyl-CoA carboxylase alpha subunit
MVIANLKGCTLKERVMRNFGQATPDGYRSLAA